MDACPPHRRDSTHGSRAGEPATRLSLLHRIAATSNGELGDDSLADGWNEFCELYTPIIFRVARKLGLQHADAEDATQEILAKVAQSIGSFDPAAGGSFRGWLSRMTRNWCLNLLTRSRQTKASGRTDVHEQLAQHAAREQTLTLLQIETRRGQFRNLSRRIQPRFSEATWSAFWMTAVEGVSIRDAARRLNKSELAIRLARCRVLSRFRELAAKEDIDDRQT